LKTWGSTSRNMKTCRKRA